MSAATAITSFRRPQQPLWNAPILPEVAGAVSPLLDLAILQAGIEGAYVYRFDRETSDVKLAAFAGPAIHKDGATLPREAGALHWNRKTPVVLQKDAASDWRFAGFPEFQTGRFHGVVSVPLLDGGESVGLANFCRTGETALAAAALSFLMSLSLPLGTLLATSGLRDQLEKATRELADRKVFERAKGVLQARFGWTEEEAYHSIRRLSRRRRRPMREIAQLVIESDEMPLEASGYE